ncbi:MAG: hypothetical protein Q4A42_03155 [Tissierellia bacterium]|nr:hypothetical protein [Tissierellia bacterium]
MKIIERRELEEMPYDKYTGDEWLHATGDEVRFEGDDTWWDEFVSQDGRLEYMR